MVRRLSSGTVVVIGLGRFGSALAETLMGIDREVLVIERDPILVRQMAPRVTLAVEGDATTIETLQSLGVGDVETAVVAIGSSLEASLLATSALSEMGVPNIWAKAVTKEHQRILERVGAHRVVFPELDMGERVAHLVADAAVKEYFEFANGYAISMVDAPPEVHNKSVAESRLISAWNIAVVGIQPAGTQDFRPVAASTVVSPSDRLIIAGGKRDVERFTLGRE